MASEKGDIDRGWAWVVLLASYINLLLCPGLCYVAGMFQIEFLEQFHSSVAFTSWVTSLFASSMQLGGPLSSLVANHFSCRTAVMLGGGLMSVGLFLSSLATSLEMLFVTFGIVAGIGVGLVFTSSIVVINYYFVERRTLVNGIALSASGLGILISPQVSRLLFDNFAWRETLTLMAQAAAHVCVAGALMDSVHEVKNKTSIIGKCLPCLPGAQRETFPGTDDNQENEEEAEVNLIQITHSDDVTNKAVNSENGRQISAGGEQNERMKQISKTRSGYEDDFQKAPTSTLDQAASDWRFHSSFSNPKPLTHAGCSQRALPRLLDSMTGSQRELMSSPSSILRVRALKTASKTRSHQELPTHHVHSQSTSSDLNQIVPSWKKDDKYSLAVSRASLHPTSKGSIGQLVVVSRNPSLVGLVPSTSLLDIVVKSKEEIQSNTSLRSTPIFDSQIVIGELSRLGTDTATLGKGDNLEEDTEFVKATLTHQFPPLYRNLMFWILCLSLFLENAGCGIFNIHFASLMRVNGLSNQELTNILSLNGLAILFGRCLCGALANSVKGIDIMLWWALHLLGGFCVLLTPVFGDNYVALMILIYGNGTYYGTVYAVLTPITISLVGLQGLASAFGIEMVMAGLGYFVAPPIAGIMVDLTSSYYYSVFCAGILYVIGGMLILLIPLLWPNHNKEKMSEDINLKGQGHKYFEGQMSTSSENCCSFDKEDL